MWHREPGTTCSIQNLELHVAERVWDYVWHNGPGTTCGIESLTVIFVHLSELDRWRPPWDRWMAFSWRGCSLPTLPPVEDPGLCDPPGEPGWLSWERVRLRTDVLTVRVLAGLNISVPPSAPRLGNQRPWYVQPCLCDWAYKRSRATYRKENGIVSRWSGSS